MLIYVATYPRSGNSWLRTMIGMNWRYQTTTDNPAGWEAFKAAASWYDVRDCGEWFGSYAHPEVGQLRLMLRAGVPLTAGLRMTLAQSPEHFFVKTHDLPHSSYFEGESAVQMVRHPLDAIASWADLTGAAPVSLIHDSARTSWAAYHAAWESAPVSLCRVFYENALRDETDAVLRLSTFLGLTVRAPRTDFLPARRAASPARYSAGHAGRFWQVLSERDIDLIWSINGAQAERLGYARPAALPVAVAAE